MKTPLQVLQTQTGTATRLRRIFAYHYDQIIRECEQEIFSNGNNIDANNLNDALVSYMEEIMDWPAADDQDKFNHRIANEI